MTHRFTEKASNIKEAAFEGLFGQYYVKDNSNSHNRRFVIVMVFSCVLYLELRVS